MRQKYGALCFIPWTSRRALQLVIAVGVAVLLWIMYQRSQQHQDLTIHQNSRMIKAVAKDIGEKHRQSTKSNLLPYPDDFVPPPYPYEVFHNCQALFENSSSEVLRDAIQWTPNNSYIGRTDDYMSVINTCDKLHAKIWFPNRPLSREEAEFPLAFVLIVHEYADQVIRLLQAIYWPQNVYCIHTDAAASGSFQKLMRLVASCFPNVLIARKRVRVVWGRISVLEAAMACMEDLLEYSCKWRYVQIYSGHDFPLKTNLEMVQIFKILNGSNDVELGDIGRERIIWMDYDGDWNETRSIPPDSIRPYKGSFQASLTREFVQFLFDNPAAQRFYRWLNQTGVPDETFWASMAHNLHLNPPGGFPGACLDFYLERMITKPWISRYQVWEWTGECLSEKWNRGSCVFGAEDLPRLIDRPELAAHKMMLRVAPAALVCLAQWHYIRTFQGHIRVSEEESQLLKPLNYSYYEGLPSVRYQNLEQGAKNSFRCILGEIIQPELLLILK